MYVSSNSVRSLLAVATVFGALAQPALAQFMQLDGEAEGLLQQPQKHGKTPTADVTPMISWVDQNVPAKGYLLCVHGLGLHKGTYSQFGERMAKLGWGVYACDIRGFGSFQELGHNNVCDFDGCLEDVRSALEMVRDQAKGKPVYIVGESMGGAIALRMAAEHPELVHGLISSVPAGERYHQGADSVKVGLKLLTGGGQVDMRKIVIDRSTDNVALREEWLNDHLARFNLSPGELIKFQKFMSENHKAAKKIFSVPVLMIQGAKDKLVKAEGNQMLIHEIPCPDAQLVFVENAEHLILEEGQFNDKVISQLDAWLESHSKNTR